jgi:hypothetical protein
LAGVGVDDIKVYFKERECGCAGFMWMRIWSSDGLVVSMVMTLEMF